jgi:cytochrome c biogenesis protein CcmG/thiol:disulfide interchange protein DsbE
MTNVVQLGPLMFAADRLLAVVLLLAFTVAVGKIGERTNRDTTKAGLWSLVAGIAAARLAYVVSHFDAYSQDWWSALAIWQGGFSAWAGIAVAAAMLLAMLGVNRTTGYSVAAVAALSLAWAGGTALLTPRPEALPEMPILATLDGGRIGPERLAGRPYVVNLWATWCPPCRRELPMLAEIASGSEVPILLVNQGESASQVERYLAQTGISAKDVALDESAAMMRIVEGGALPTTLFINARGQVVEAHLGEISRAALLDQINRLQEE